MSDEKIKGRLTELNQKYRQLDCKVDWRELMNLARVHHDSLGGASGDVQVDSTHDGVMVVFLPRDPRRQSRFARPPDIRTDNVALAQKLIMETLSKSMMAKSYDTADTTIPAVIFRRQFDWNKRVDEKEPVAICEYLCGLADIISEWSVSGDAKSSVDLWALKSELSELRTEVASLRQQLAGTGPGAGAGAGTGPSTGLNYRY